MKVTFEKVNMDLVHNRKKLYQYVKGSKIFSNLAMQENADLVMFYGITVMKDQVLFYSKSL
jgi:hypothetical protein